MIKRRSGLVLIIVGFALLLTACQSGSVKTRKTIPDWSRGLQLGVAALNQPVDIIASGTQVHVLWVSVGNRSLHYVRLDRAGHIEVSSELEVGGAHPNDAQLLLNHDGTLTALWTDNPGIPRALFLAEFSPEGILLTGPTQLSPVGVRVADIATVTNPDGSHELFWNDENPAEGGLHHVRLAGQATSDERLLVSGAGDATVQVAADGMLHLAWVEQPSTRENHVYYALFDASTGALTTPTRVATYLTATGLISYPPRMGLDAKRVYLFWALEQRGGGNNPGEAHTAYVSFLLGQPQLVEPITLDIPGLARPTYAPASGSLPYHQLAATDAAWPTSLLYMPSTTSGQNEGLGIFVVAQVSTRNQTNTQVAWALFEEGQLKGYQLPSAAGNALRPEAALDQYGDVHLVWLDTGGFGRYEVYYASTSEEAKANLDRVTLQDRATDLLNALWNLAPALGFFPPVFLLWTALSFAWVCLYYFIRVEGGMERHGSRAALAVAIVLYELSKLFLMPGVLFYVPFIDRVPEGLQIIPVLAIPLLTALTAAAALWFYARRRQYRSLFASYLIFVLTDSLLSLVIYVPRWLQG